MVTSVSVLGDLDSAAFLQRHWQKEPLLVRGAFPAVGGVVDGDTLAGLACEPEVESRLVSVDAAGEDWSCENGPFDEARFAALPAAGWTLLVQAVDHWIPGVAALRERFAFLPRWRMDDVMVSYAAEGGGVGPHFDHYDVFLLQAQGVRRWQVGQRCDSHSRLRDHPSLKLLAEFHTREDWRLEPGDLLYLPGGVAHWGTAASGDCITCSIGFRAPSHAEIVQGAVDEVLSRRGDDHRYVDVAGAIDADPFRINDAALAHVRSLWRSEDTHALGSALETAFGRLVTEPRDPGLVQPPGTPADAAAAVHARLAGTGVLQVAHNPISRFAYRARGGLAVLYVDGEDHPVSTSLARGICAGRVQTDDLADAASRALLLRLLEQGSLLLAD